MGAGLELHLPGPGGQPAAAPTPLTPGFVREVEDLVGKMVSRCYQCKKCTSGCPVSYTLDHQCHEVIRLVQLGARDAVLRSEAIWLCASCKTCRERCPNDVDPAAVMDALKILAVAGGTPVARKRVRAFQKAFLNTIAAFGRAHEFGAIALYGMGNPAATMGDVPMGAKMFLRGKLKLMPDRIRGRREVAAIFKRAKEKEAELKAKGATGAGPAAGGKGGAGK